MIVGIKIAGLNDVINSLQGDFLGAQDIDAEMQQATKPLIRQIQNNYIKAGHKKTGALIDSIEAFKGSKRSRKYDIYTWYVGPRYTTRSSIWSLGGNAAHLLEWGTNARHKADVKKGGYAGAGTGSRKNRKTIYGAKIKLGGVKGTGVLRRSYDEMKDTIIEDLQHRMLELLKYKASREGFQTK